MKVILLLYLLFSYFQVIITVMLNFVAKLTLKRVIQFLLRQFYSPQVEDRDLKDFGVCLMVNKEIQYH